MLDKNSLQLRHLSFVAVVMAMLGSAPQAVAVCSETEHVAIFVFDNLAPSFTPQVTTLAVTPVGEAVFPDMDQISGILMQYFQSGQGVGPGELAGNMWSWWGVQQSAQAIVDRRDGAVLFAGTMVWMGNGQLLHPLVSSHEWEVVASEQAPAPTITITIANGYWSTAQPTEAELTASAVSYLRSTDVIHSFADCGEYRAVAWVYTPSVGGTDVSVAKLIVAIDGTVGAPWNGQSVADEKASWGGFKVQYR